MGNQPITNAFLGPMRPFPGLERWSRQLRLPRSGITLHLYEGGEESRMPLLLLHGLGDEADTWRHILPLLAGHYRVIAPDLPGFGRSDKGKHPYTIQFYMDTVLELLDFLSISRTALAGHSAGAIIAQSIALEHPQRVERLILVGGSLVSEKNRPDPGLILFLLPVVGEWMYNRLRKDPQSAYRTLEGYYNRLNDLPQADQDFLYQRVNERVWSDGQRQGFLSTLRNLVKWLPSQQKNLPERLHRQVTPTLVIWGENDRINLIENARALARLMPSARLQIVPGAGHNVHQEQPQVVAEAIIH